MLKDDAAESSSPCIALSREAPLWVQAKPKGILICQAALPNLKTNKRKLESTTLGGGGGNKLL
jgi:hypothetical protein